MRATNAFHTIKVKESFREEVSDFDHRRMTRTSFGDFGGNEKFKNTKSIMYIILVFLGMGYVGVTFVFSILAYQNTSSKTWNISQIVSNWKLKPIVSISSTNEENCSTGYEPIFESIWPGTFDGCYCDNRTPDPILKNSLVKGKCDKIQENNGCRNIKAENPRRITQIHSDTLICAQRSGKNIIDTERPTVEENGELKCEGDYVVCGPEDREEDQLCVAPTEDCPIISIGYGDHEDEKYPPETWTQVNISDTKALFYSSTDREGGLPIAEFRLAEGDHLCIKEADHFRPEDKKIYSLLNDNFYKGCVTNVDGLERDNRWASLLTTTEWDVFQGNEHLWTVLSNDLPNYVNETAMRNSEYSLFYRPYIEWNSQCEEHEDSKMKILAEHLNPINTLANAQLFYMVICFLSLLVLGITTPIFILIRHCMILRGEKKETYRDVIISTGMRFVSMIFIILKASFLISCLVLIQNYHFVYEKAKEHECTDETTEYVLAYVDEYLEEARKADWVSLGAVITIAFCEIIAIFILFMLKRKGEASKRDARQSLLESLSISKE